jgi:hypothetical protein
MQPQSRKRPFPPFPERLSIPLVGFVPLRAFLWDSIAIRRKIFLRQTFVARHPGAGKLGEHDGARRSEEESDSRF